MSNEIITRIESDKSKATLVIQPGFYQSMMNSQTLLAIAIGAGVKVDQAVERAIEEFIEQYTPGIDPIEVIIASAIPPENGEDGKVEWVEKYDPTNSVKSDESDNQSTDHYLGKSYIQVSAGDVIARLHEPTGGTDGRNVLGGCINAMPGKRSGVKLNQTVRLDSDGYISANIDGVISFKANEITIANHLIVPDCVDFSTGHIDFSGSVSIKNGIRTGFNVNANDNVQVGGLIEASKVTCKGDLIAKQGMAGKGRGTIEVEGNVVATYLEDVSGSVGGDLSISNSLIGCRLVISGNIISTSGVIRGGILNIAGTLNAKILGAESSPPTRLYLGSNLTMTKALESMYMENQTTNEKLKTYQAEYIQLTKTDELTNEDKERVTELLFSIQEMEELQISTINTIEKTEEQIKETSKLNVQVSKCIHSGVTLVIGKQEYRFNSTITGPLTIFLNNEGQVVCKAGSEDTKSIETIAKVSSIQLTAAA